MKRKEVVSFRLPLPVVEELDKIAQINRRNRTDEVIRYLKAGIERTRKNIDARFISFAIMVLTLASASLWIWLVFF